MKKLSIFQISLLAGFGAFAVVGVLIFAFAIGGNTKSAIGPVIIWGTLDATAFNTTLRAAADADATLSQVSYVQKDPTTYQSDLTEALASGTGPDLFIITQDEVVKDAGTIVVIPFTSVSQTQFQNTFITAADAFLSQNGSAGFPLLADPLVLYWNKDMLASSGISEPPQYWDQVLSMAQLLTTKDSSGNLTKEAIALGEYDNVDNAKDILATLIMQAGDPITTRDNSGRLISDLVPKDTASQTATSNALRFYTGFADPSQPEYSWNASLPDAQQQFAAGDLALYIGYASEAPVISSENPNLDFGVTPIPQIRGATSTIDTARVYALAASKTGKNPLGAVSAAAALATAANSSAFASALGLVSARRDVLAQNSPALSSSVENLVSTGDSASGTDPIVYSAGIARSWIDPDPVATASLFQAMIENTTSGALLVDAAIQRADQQMSQIISQELPQQ